MIKIKLNENLLNEEVIGAQAFVYHGSRTAPDKFLPLILDDKFSPGSGAGDDYGPGLYTVYNLDGTATKRGTYGRYIYKFKINLNGFVIFDMDIAEKVYGKRIPPHEQARQFGISKLSVLNMSTIWDEGIIYTSDIAAEASNYLQGKVKGIVFTGRNDGNVAVIYDPSICIPISYMDIKDGSFQWKKFDIDIIKNKIKQNLDDKFEIDKYRRKVDFSQTEFEYPVLATGKQLRLVKEGSIFKNDLYIMDASDKDIPKNIKVHGLLKFDNCWMERLPEGIEAEELDIYQCKKLKEIPADIKITKSFRIYNCFSLSSIPIKELKLKKHFYLGKCPNLKMMPEKLVLENGDMNIIDCENLIKLPDYLICSQIYIYREGHQLALPNYLYLKNEATWKLEHPIIEPLYLWDEFVERIREFDIPQYNMLSKKYGKPLHDIAGNYSYLDESMIAEMPIKNYQTIGNFEKPGTFKGPDQKMMNHPGYIRKLERFFSRSRYDMNFWMSHKPGMRREREQGIISPEKVRELFPKEADAILKDREDAITVIFLGNYGDNKVMMTPWIVAHRMGHAFTASNRYRKTSRSGQLWKEMEQSIFEEIHSMMRDKYGMVATRLAGYNVNLNDSYRQIFEAIGTSKSARDKNLPRPYEFLYECLAQFIMSGEIKFNPMPPRIGAGKKTFGRHQSSYRWNGSDEERKEFADDLADLMTWRMDEILSGSLSDIFLM